MIQRESFFYQILKGYYWLSGVSMVADWGQENIKEYSRENDKYYSLNKSDTLMMAGKQDKEIQLH